jgi:signal transduction histidine kinase
MSNPTRYLIIVSILLGQIAFGQTKFNDSLITRLNTSEGFQKVDLLNQLAYEFISKDNVRAMEYCDEAIALAKKLNYEKGIAQAYTYRGVYEYLSGEFSDGRLNLRRGIALASKAHDRRNEGYSLTQLGNSFMNQGQLDSALVFYYQAYKILSDSTDAILLSKLYRSLSVVYGLRSELDSEKKYLLRALKIREKIGDKYLLTDALIALAGLNTREGNFSQADQNLSMAKQILQTNPDDAENLNDWRHQRALVLLHEGRHQKALALLDSAITFFSRNSMLQKYVFLQFDVGKIFNDRGEYEIALRCFEDALKVAETKGFDVEIADIDLQIGWINFNLGETSQALKLADRTLLWAEQNRIPTRKCDALILKGIAYNTSKDYASAKTSLDQALAISKKLKDKIRISESYENLGFLELNRGNLDLALDYYARSVPPADSARFEYGLVWSFYGLGSTNLKLGRFQKALTYFNEAEKKALKLDAKKALTHLYKQKSEIFKLQRNFGESMHYSRMALSIYDSLNRSVIARRFASLQRFDEIRQKERELKSLNLEKQFAQQRNLLQEQKLSQQNYLLVLSISLIAVLAALAFVYARFYFRVRRLNLAVMLQKEELLTQSNYIHQLNKNLEGLVEEKTIELQKTNNELIKQNDELLQFSYSVSHNLRGPVARMLGLTNVFRYSKDLQEQNLMIEQVHRASRDLDGILTDLSKIIDIRNDLHTMKEWVDLEQEWLIARALLRDVIKEQFHISYDFVRVAKIFTIKAFIQSVFYNLLSNAIKYRDPNRNLNIRVVSKLEDGNVIIEIIDNGIGIDLLQAKPSLFKLFKRFHTHVEGRGLGLYLVKSQIESLNGSLQVESVVNEGSIFKVMIPGVLKATSEKNVLTDRLETSMRAGI